MKEAKSKYSIAHVHWGFPPVIGGVETHLTILLPTLVKMGHNVSLLTCSVEGQKGDDEYEGVKIKRAPIMDLNWLAQRGLEGIEGEVRQVFKEFIDQNKPDIIHTHNMHYFSKPHIKILEELCIAKGLPLFLTAHNVWDDNLFLDLTVRIKWSHIIAVSHFIEKELIGVGCHHRNVTTIHHGIDEEMFHPRVSPENIIKKYPQLAGKEIFFHPARMGLAKGCDVSIKALKIIKEVIPNIMLVLAGTKNIVDWESTQQKDIAYMVQLVDEFGLRDNVLIDSYDLQDMPALYAASKVCVYPSTASEPFGLTMLEAMASAKPMIVTRAGGMPEIIQNGINGFIVPIKGYEELANHVIQLINSDMLRERLGSTGRRMVEKDYTHTSVAEQTLNLYSDYLGQGSKPPIYIDRKIDLIRDKQVTDLN